nr:asparaginase [FCB group bacterium]
ITCGAADKFGFTEEETALMCGSHNGEQCHIEIVARILNKIGLDEQHLQCGIHPPLDKETARSIKESGSVYSQLHNNCSGKHAAILAGSLYMGYPIDDYLSAGHPWQKMIIETISTMCDYPAERIGTGIDGCGVPVYAAPLYNAALAAAVLAKPAGQSTDTASVCQRIFKAMITYPYMIAGRNRICTDLITAGGGKIAAKAGAEGFYLVSVRKEDEGIGIAVKIDDGAERARDAIVIEILSAMKLLDKTQLTALAKYHRPAIYNHKRIVVGRINPICP